MYELHDFVIVAASKRPRSSQFDIHFAVGAPLAIGMQLAMFISDARASRARHSIDERKEKTMQRASTVDPKHKPFQMDIETLRKRARQHIESGAVTDGYSGDVDTVINILNEALATEIVCVLRYKRHYFMADGLNADSVAAEFSQHAQEEQAHADMISERIIQLGGEPNYSPDGLRTRSHTEYVPGDSLISMLKEDLVAERIAIDSYRAMIDYVADTDPTTRRMLEQILADEEEHAEDLATLMAGVNRK